MHGLQKEMWSDEATVTSEQATFYLEHHSSSTRDFGDSRELMRPRRTEDVYVRTYVRDIRCWEETINLDM